MQAMRVNFTASSQKNVALLFCVIPVYNVSSWWADMHVYTHKHTSGYQHVYEAWRLLLAACFLRSLSFWAAFTSERNYRRAWERPCNFQWGGVMFSYALCNGELLFSLPLLLNGPHHSNMWRWSIWMSLTPAALRSSLHSLHSLNRSNWIKETAALESSWSSKQKDY